ncbi:hypothetical protein CN268_20105 [Bacillus anthracis]|nr:hypothetical protein CN488_26325 [Bacillus anthracis]PFB59150.1 hypothetical protein CN268_20105 [Bacillus anthracis]PGR29402.1 hypothetical protein COC50_02335 [Bacillus anthracis]
MLSLQVFKKFLIIFGLIAVLSSLLALWFRADATFKEKMILSLIFGIVMPLAFFIFYKITSLFLK